MPGALLFYMDDSGSRHPDHAPQGNGDRPDWFGLGGILIHEGDKAAAEELIDAFRRDWPQMRDAPLHSFDIRTKDNGFRWLAQASAETRKRFLVHLTELMLSLPIQVLGCVVDRPGYNDRYREKYGRQRWLLCRTAFMIAVERAAKYALHLDCRLRVYVERTGKEVDEQMRTYYEELRAQGAPFDKGKSSQYNPMTADQFATRLLEFDVKGKQSIESEVLNLNYWTAS